MVALRGCNRIAVTTNATPSGMPLYKGAVETDRNVPSNPRLEIERWQVPVNS